MYRPIVTVLISLSLLGPAAASAGSEHAAPQDVRIAGCGSMQALIGAWSRELGDSEIRVHSEGRGSSTGPPALISGRAEIAGMSRRMNSAELEVFRRRFGYEPTAVPVAAEAVTVYVNARNPLERLTLAEVDAIFSETRYCGAEREIQYWGDLGLDGDWAGRTISLHGRGLTLGKCSLFQNVALCGGVFQDSLRESPGDASSVMSVSEAVYGIGYGSWTDGTPGVKLLALARQGDEPFATLSPESVYSGAYPLARELLLYVNRAPGAALDPRVAPFIEYVLSDAGQSVVEESGYLRVPPALVQEILASLR
jgi:phosphate transport system substrate-binding protein